VARRGAARGGEKGGKPSSGSFVGRVKEWFREIL